MMGDHEKPVPPALLRKPVADAPLPHGLEQSGISLEAMLEAMPVSAVVLDEQRRIVASNVRMMREFGAEALQALSGRRLGEAIGCSQVAENARTCGSSGPCAWCGALHAITTSMLRRVPITAECRMSSQQDGGSALDVEVRASPLQVGTAMLTVVSLRDISAEKRRRVLERIFFHDVLNTAGGICGIANVLIEGHDPAAEQEFKLMLLSLSDQLIDEITSQRQLMAAELGELQVVPSEVAVSELLRNVRASWSNAQAASGKTVSLGPEPAVRLTTDVTLLRRILGNMLKNALEASPQGGEVTLYAEELGDEIAFAVHNAGTMPIEVQQQVFLRSFSTKGEGRGIGTYSIKLLGEKYLRGSVSFRSVPASGTIFRIRLAKRWRAADGVPGG